MEEKGREAPLPPVSAEPAPPETLVEGSRRRASAPKRKGPSGSLSSSTSAKRLAKERNHLPFFVPHVHHNGPVTRARQSPNKFAGAAAAAPPPNPEEKPAASDAAGAAGCKEGEGAGEQQAGQDGVLDRADEPVVDAEFEAVRTRDSNVHVVPTHAGKPMFLGSWDLRKPFVLVFEDLRILRFSHMSWFSWEKTHQLEERTMACFFNGKSEKRTSDIYKKIRNSIMEKFHSDPQTEIELKHLSDMEVGDADARQEVMEFLDHWGLINFHPFPPSPSDTSALDNEKTAKTPSLCEKLYQFETVHPPPRLAPKTVEVSEQTMLPRLFPESTVADDIVRPEGPSVEYHCNSCSADCSRKRYHCQKQADFDLCTECFSNGKFGSGMTPADFILMEPAEVPGTGGGSWTDQETLLLLEALELYGENWNEIAEHVATKTKAQCMLHFVQMPIEDTFLEDDEDKHERKSDDVLMSKDSSTPDVTEKVENKVMENEDRHETSSVSTAKENDDGKAETYQGTSSADIAIDALKTAFQAVGSMPEDGGPFSFAEAGNPVMALAAFLVALVDHDLALKSSRSSLKAMAEDSAGIQLATRHCFILEDPPKHQKDLHTSESEDAQREDAQVPVTNGNDEVQGTNDKNDKIEVPMHNAPSVSSEQCTQDSNGNKSTDLDVSVKEGLSVKKSGDLSGCKNVQKSIKDPHELSLPNEKATGSSEKMADDLDPHGGDNPNAVKESGESHAEVTKTTSKDKVAKCSPLTKEGDSALPGQQANAIKDSGDVTASVGGNKESSEVQGTVKMLSAEEKGHLNTVDSSSAAEIRELAGILLLSITYVFII
ncbi:hypothetical protein Taro_015839 [Colocasia esculenta]|uniref:SWI/SNF complex subunit SWI3D n=1 Tax=Colocasia esculenta TaxID=4460 RepID=A0A843UCC5_COLES|nr:hypothetical protein [Colocasia esculenta]